MSIITSSITPILHNLFNGIDLDNDIMQSLYQSASTITHTDVTEAFRLYLIDYITCKVDWPSITYFENCWLETHEIVYKLSIIFNFIPRLNLNILFNQCWEGFLEEHGAIIILEFNKHLMDTKYLNFIKTIEKHYLPFYKLLIESIYLNSPHVTIKCDTLKNYIAESMCIITKLNDLVSFYDIDCFNFSRYTQLIYNTPYIIPLIKCELEDNNYEYVNNILKLIHDIKNNNNIINLVVEHFTHNISSKLPLIKTVNGYINKLIIIHSHFNNNTATRHLQNRISEYYKDIMNCYDNYDTFILQYLNHKITKNLYLCIHTLSLMDYIKDKDIFLEKYKVKLTKRLIIAIQMHYQDYRILDKIKTYDLIEFSTTSKMIIDKAKSYKLNSELQVNPTYITNLSYASMGMWPIKASNTTVSPQSAFMPQKLLIENMLHKKYPERILQWNTNCIIGIMTVSINNREIEIEANVDIIDVLLQFNDNTHLVNVRTDIVNCLMGSGIILHNVTNNSICINENYNKLVNKRIVLSTRPKPINKTIKRKIETVERSPYIQALIVNYMKKNKDRLCNVDELFTICKETTAKRFDLERPLFDENITKLDSHDYIKLSKDKSMIDYVL
jgi:hypothetical protein